MLRISQPRSCVSTSKNVILILTSQSVFDGATWYLTTGWRSSDRTQPLQMVWTYGRLPVRNRSSAQQIYSKSTYEICESQMLDVLLCRWPARLILLQCVLYRYTRERARQNSPEPTKPWETPSTDRHMPLNDRTRPRASLLMDGRACSAQKPVLNREGTLARLSTWYHMPCGALGRYYPW